MGEASEALAQVERAEATTGQTVAQSMGDCAYGGGETRQAFADTGRELLAKVPQENENQGRFTKRALVIDREQETMTCPGGETTARFAAEQDGSNELSARPSGDLSPLVHLAIVVPVLPALNLTPPSFVVAVPGDRLRQRLLEGVRRLPA